MNRNGFQKYPMPIYQCYVLGTQSAAHGIPWDFTKAKLLEAGYEPNSWTVKRVKRAYDEQIARG